MSNPTLEDLLDRTAAALLLGDLAALAELAPQTEALAETPVALDRSAAERLRVKAERNARLLTAATRGLRSARARMVEIAAGPTLTTYDALGRRSSLAPPPTIAPRRV
jgi:hypothetical protein